MKGFSAEIPPVSLLVFAMKACFAITRALVFPSVVKRLVNPMKFVAMTNVLLPTRQSIAVPVMCLVLAIHRFVWMETAQKIVGI